MTHKTTMPEPVLTRRVFHPSTGEVEQHLITTDQAEAYAEARVREALGPVIDELERICAADRAGDCESIAMDALSDIRALFPDKYPTSPTA